MGMTRNPASPSKLGFPEPNRPTLTRPASPSASSRRWRSSDARDSRPEGLGTPLAVVPPVPDGVVVSCGTGSFRERTCQLTIWLVNAQCDDELRRRFELHPRPRVEGIGVAGVQMDRRRYHVNRWDAGRPGAAPDDLIRLDAGCSVGTPAPAPRSRGTAPGDASISRTRPTWNAPNALALYRARPHPTRSVPLRSMARVARGFTVISPTQVRTVTTRAVDDWLL
jgi:hypothetical protein